MDHFERIKEALPLTEYAEAHLQHGRERGSYVCPICGSGTGTNKTAALKIYGSGKKWKCFSCDNGGDVFDLIGAVEEITEKSQQLARAAELAGLGSWNQPYREAKQPPKPVRDYSQGTAKHGEYLRACRERLATQGGAAVEGYLQARGYTLEEARRLGFGYDPEHLKAWRDEEGNWTHGARLVIPWTGSNYYHIDRAIDPHAVEVKYSKPRAEEVGTQPLYNPHFTEHEYVFVVEGALDAAPITLLGYNVVALGGTGTNPLISTVRERHYSGAVIDMLDADKRGRETAEQLAEALQDAEATFLKAEEYGLESKYAGRYKDPGEWFAADRKQLGEMLETARALALDKLNARRAEEYRAALQRLNVKDPAREAYKLLDTANLKEPTPTGLETLDNALNGGLRPGELTFLGANSSYGKTSLCNQVADSIAARGLPVVFVTIEQSAQEIIAKSISRLIYVMNPGGYNIASAGEITDRRRRVYWSDSREKTLQAACEHYAQDIAPYMHILEGTEQPRVNDIRAVVETVKEHAGRAPFVFIDYLQLLAPVDGYTSDKRTIDQNVTALRALARDTGAHVVCVSSLNRSSYSGAISYDSFKESGGIEYGADCLIGLQPRGIARKLDGVKDQDKKREADKIYNEAKAQRERPCEIVILKHRNGALPAEPIPVTFKAECALFVCD